MNLEGRERSSYGVEELRRTTSVIIIAIRTETRTLNLLTMQW